jgi:hypothetical protein
MRNGEEWDGMFWSLERDGTAPMEFDSMVVVVLVLVGWFYRRANSRNTVPWDKPASDMLFFFFCTLLPTVYRIPLIVFSPTTR